MTASVHISSKVSLLIRISADLLESQVLHNHLTAILDNSKMEGEFVIVTSVIVTFLQPAKKTARGRDLFRGTIRSKCGPVHLSPVLGFT